MPNVEKILAERVEFQVESIDRMYLNLYVPRVQHPNGVLQFLLGHRRQQIASPALLGQMTRDFVADVNAFADKEGIPVVAFPKGERKEDIAKKEFAAFEGEEGVVFIGVAQERTSGFRSTKEKRSDGLVRFNFYRGAVSVNHYYFYILDRDFGPAFIKLCSYFPFTGRVWLNGHEWAKRQLDQAGIGYEALDNGFRSVEDSVRLQALCDSLSAETVQAFISRWLSRLPSPFLPEDQLAGYRHDISILQFEMSLTQVFRRPLDGRYFFEEVIRDHLDLGRPEQVRLVFGRRITRRTPGHFQTRIITRDVAPSLSFPYKRSRIKQYFKEGRALRTETTINDPKDFGVGKRLCNLDSLREIGRQANRRLVGVQRLAHDCSLGQEIFRHVVRPSQHEGQRAPGLRFGDERTSALLTALCGYAPMVEGFTNHSLRARVGALLDPEYPETYTRARMTYDLRRLRLKDLIARIPRSHRYEITPLGRRVALFFSKTQARLFAPGLASLAPPDPDDAPAPLHQAWHRLDRALDQLTYSARLAA
jgi:hypothetical protein